MTAADTVKIRTFWLSILAAVALPGLFNYATMSAVVEQLSVGQEQNALAIREIQQDILRRTDERFRRSDWEKEEAKLNHEMDRLHEEVNRLMDKVDDIWRYISTQGQHE